MTGGRLGEIGESIGGALLRQAGRVAARIQERSGLDADLLENDDAYLVVFDAPGANRSDVQVRYDDGAVTVRVDRFRSFYEGYEMSIPGRGLSLDGRVELPSRAVDPAAATAVLTDRGTLEVTVPKTADAPDRSEVEDATVDADDVETVDRTEEDTDFEFGPGEEDDGDGDPIDLTEVDDDAADEGDDEAGDGGVDDHGGRDSHDDRDGSAGQSSGEGSIGEGDGSTDADDAGTDDADGDGDDEDEDEDE